MGRTKACYEDQGAQEAVGPMLARLRFDPSEPSLYLVLTSSSFPQSNGSPGSFSGHLQQLEFCQPCSYQYNLNCIFSACVCIGVWARAQSMCTFALTCMISISQPWMSLLGSHAPCFWRHDLLTRHDRLARHDRLSWAGWSKIPFFIELWVNKECTYVTEILIVN